MAVAAAAADVHVYVVLHPDGLGCNVSASHKTQCATVAEAAPLIVVQLCTAGTLQQAFNILYCQGRWRSVLLAAGCNSVVCELRLLHAAVAPHIVDGRIHTVNA